MNNRSVALEWAGREDIIMTMAERYCNESIRLDKINANTAWNRTPNLSIHQQGSYINAEQRQRNKLFEKYPHEYVAKVRTPASETNSKTATYNVIQLFADGSKLDCLPMLQCELDNLVTDGNKVTIE